MTYIDPFEYGAPPIDDDYGADYSTDMDMSYDPGMNVSEQNQGDAIPNYDYVAMDHATTANHHSNTAIMAALPAVYHRESTSGRTHPSPTNSVARPVDKMTVAEDNVQRIGPPINATGPPPPAANVEEAPPVQQAIPPVNHDPLPDEEVQLFDLPVLGTLPNLIFQTH